MDLPNFWNHIAFVEHWRSRLQKMSLWNINTKYLHLFFLYVCFQHAQWSKSASYVMQPSSKKKINKGNERKEKVLLTDVEGGIETRSLYIISKKVYSSTNWANSMPPKRTQGFLFLQHCAKLGHQSQFSLFLHVLFICRVDRKFSMLESFSLFSERIISVKVKGKFNEDRPMSRFTIMWVSITAGAMCTCIFMTFFVISMKFLFFSVV